MLPRILEAEAMDSAEDAADYDAMDHSGVNQAFAKDFLTRYADSGPALDVGTGTAQIPIEICRQSPTITIVAVDLSGPMLTIGQRNVEAAGFAKRIVLKQVNARGLPFANGQFPAVISNSIIHHIPEPRDCFSEMVRVCAPGGTLFVRDLFRPASRAMLDDLVQTYARNETAHQRQLFADSLHAALTLNEVRAIVAEFGFKPDTVAATSDRHWTWHAIRRG